MEYHIVWRIDTEAESFEDATRIAREIQQDPNSLATHFSVECESGECREVWSDDGSNSKP